MTSNWQAAAGLLITMSRAGIRPASIGIDAEGYIMFHDLDYMAMGLLMSSEAREETKT